MKKILVIGGSVFASKSIAEYFAAYGCNVFVLNRGTKQNAEGAIFLKADRNDPRAFMKAIGNHDFDLVIDVCAYLPTQTKIAVDVLKDRTAHFIHISSAAVYDNIKSYPIHENNERGGASIWGEYGRNKYLCEEELLREWNISKFPITLLRPFYIYGPGNNLERESYIFERIINNKPIIVPGMGRPIIQFGYIDDLSDCILKIGNQEKSFGQAYNISGKEYVTFVEWINICANVVSMEAEIYCTECELVGYNARKWFPFRDVHLFGG